MKVFPYLLLLTIGRNSKNTVGKERINKQFFVNISPLLTYKRLFLYSSAVSTWLRQPLSEVFHLYSNL